MHGERAGLLALSLWCFSPEVIAYGQMMTGDLAAASLGVCAMYLYWHWPRRPGWAQAYFLGLAVGLALMAKTSWVILYALLPGLWLVSSGIRLVTRSAEAGSPPTPRHWRTECVQLVLTLVLGVLVVNLGYGFDGSGKTLGEYLFASRALGGKNVAENVADWAGNRFAGTWLGRLPVPLPEDFVQGIDVQKWDMTRERWSYLRGQWRDHGWWYFYLYGMGVKWPLGMLALVGFAAATAGWSWRLAKWRDELVLLAPAAAVLVLISSETGLNKHSRYVLPLTPFVIVAVSRVASRRESATRLKGPVIGVCLTWTIASSLWIYPHSLSYFNELVGGPMHGHQHLISSNLDWGQDLLFLKRWREAHPEARPLRVAYTLWVVPLESAGIEEETDQIAKPFYFKPGVSKITDARNGPRPDWFAVDVSHLTRQDGLYRVYERFTPVGMAGYSFRIYHITEAEANRVRRELGIATE